MSERKPLPILDQSGKQIGSCYTSAEAAAILGGLVKQRMVDGQPVWMPAFSPDPITHSAGEAIDGMEGQVAT